jgi:hypothetical protein
MNIFGIIALYFLSIICVSIIIGEITLRIERKNNKPKRKSIFEISFDTANKYLQRMPPRNPKGLNI